MAAPFPLSDRASVVRPSCKTQRIAPTLRQVADLMCARIKEREYFKTCIVGQVNCCLSVRLRLLCATHRQVSLIICVTRLASWFARQRRQQRKTSGRVITLRKFPRAGKMRRESESMGVLAYPALLSDE
ncbi:hypothetical protein PoB_003194600 [Plakobranchus ocellatus]|uniref:Uncharacterized protein n=1 Tax=Plakobranchus ocellatus TaxID=259542 RepID=A0AAV4A2I7_9GAST|nr:hypothetical protein PoB_003194600 [Plakobranchus ocellatus]